MSIIKYSPDSHDPAAWAELVRRGLSKEEARPKGTVRVTVDLHPLMAALLDVTSAHLGKNRSHTVEDALRCLFASLPRPDDERSR